MVRSFLSVDALSYHRSKIEMAVKQFAKADDTMGMARHLFKHHIAPVTDPYFPIVSQLASHYGDCLYRGRKCIDGVAYTDIKDLLNPPVSSGRALSSLSTPILYASTSLQTCKAELDLKVGDLVNIVGLKYSDIMNKHFWFIGQLASFYKSKEPSHYIGERKLLNITAYYPQDAQQSFIYTDALLNEVFSKYSSADDGYALNRYLIDAINKKRSDDNLLSGVVYQSIKDAPGINFAIFGDSIGKLEVGQLNFIEITDIDDYGTVGYRLLQNGSLENGKITWRNVS